MSELSVELAEDAPQRSFLTIFGPAVAVILGVSVWVQLASFTVRGDVAVSSMSRALAIGLPLVALLGGVYFRSAIVLLAFFPMTLLPPLLLTPDGAVASFGDPWSAGRACASVALFLALVGAWLGSVEEDSETTADPTRARRGYATDARRYVFPRVMPLLLWWAVPTYALFWDPAIVGTLQQSFAEDARIAQMFASVMMFFAWAVVAYMWFIVPSLNLEYDRRQFRRDARALVADEPRTILRRIGITAIVTLVVLAALLILVSQ